ncbi:MAG: hypothetical protein RLZ32_2975, partial [Gemmatimonadota bacterium]
MVRAGRRLVGARVAGVALAGLAGLVPTGAHGQAGVAVRQLHGVVQTAAHTGGMMAIGDAEVILDWRNNDVLIARNVRTDAKGRFTLRDLPPRAVRLTVRALGYAPVVRTMELGEADRLVTITLTPTATALAAVAVRGDTVAERLARVAATSTLDAEALAAVRGQTLGESIKHLP